MVELELTEVNDKNKAALRNLEMLLASSKDTESDGAQSDLLQRLDSMAKDNDDLVSKVNTLQEELEKMEMNVSDNVGTNEMQEEMEKLKESMHTEKMLKVQAINKLQD